MSEFQHTYSGGESQCSHCGGWTRGANLRTECPTRLRAEVERLHLDRDDIEHAYNFARDKAKLLERQAVVAWLRAEANAPHPIEAGERALSPSGCGLLLLNASRIERGEHSREEVQE